MSLRSLPVVLLLSALCCGQASAQEPTEASVRTQIADDLPSTGRMEISAADLRGVLENIVTLIPDETDISGYISPFARMGSTATIPSSVLAAGGGTGNVLERTASGQRWRAFGPVIDDRIATWARVTSPTGSAPANRLGASWTGAGAFLMSPSSISGAASWAFLTASDIRSGTFADARLPAGIARDTELPAAPATWAYASSPTGRAPLSALPVQLGRIPAADCTNGQVWKRGSAVWGCAADAVGAGGGIDQSTALGLIAMFARAGSTSGSIPTARLTATAGTTGQFLRKTATAHAFETVTIPDAPAAWAGSASTTSTIPLARFLAGGTTGDLVQRTATGMQWASQDNAVDDRVFVWARADARAQDLVPAIRIDNAIARDGELIGAVHHDSGADRRGQVLVSEGVTGISTRGAGDYDYIQIFSGTDASDFEIMASAISNDVTRDAEIPAALFASAFGSAVRGGCLQHDGGATFTRTDFVWAACGTGGGGASSTFSTFAFSMTATNISTAAAQVTITGSAQNGLSVSSGCVSVGSSAAGNYHIYAKADFVPNRTEPPGTVGPNRNFPDIILRRTRSSTNTDTVIRTPYIRGFHDGQSPARMTEAVAWFIEDAQDGDSYCIRLDASQASAHQADFLAVSNGVLNLISLP